MSAKPHIFVIRLKLQSINNEGIYGKNRQDVFFRPVERILFLPTGYYTM